MSEPDDAGSDQGSADSQERTDRLGKLLPDRTSDESAIGWGDEDAGDPDERLRREVPPHHG